MTFFTALKRAIFGRPIATSRAHHERLPKIFGLPVFASDAISSVAYATEEVLLVLMLAGTAGTSKVTYFAIAIAVLIAIVVFSYVRTIFAYPKGGGGYRVTSDNLGSKAGRVAGAALLIDYVLTVAVSVSSGVLAIVSAFPALQEHTVLLGLCAIALMMFINMRGARESGLVFAVPTYLFITLLLVLIIKGLFMAANGEGMPNAHPGTLEPVEGHVLGVWLVLRAFSAGCTALTGIEAIADGAGAFRPPEARNASITLMMLGAILSTLFVGVSWMTSHFGIVPMEVGSEGYKTVVAQLAEGAFGMGPMFYTIQIATMAILILAANTAYADFPRLCSFIANDSYLPRQLANLGDRLVYQNGILLLSICAGLLIWVFHGDTHSLIPLYAVGVFTSFTLSQSGMVVRQLRKKSRFWNVAVSVIGALVTGSVMIVILITKFEAGAYLVTIAVGALLLFFYGVRRHYDSLARQLSVSPDDKIPHIETTVLLLVPRIHKGILNAIAYAQNLGPDVRGVHISINPETREQFKQEWLHFAPQIPLVVLDSQYRSLVEPLMEYIDEAVGEDPGKFLTVIVPQAVPKRWWQGILHNNSALPIKLALASRRNVVITNVRYFLE